jgi:hypothetical protein
MAAAVIYSIFLLWLLALVPAAIVCLVKRRWLMFVAGFLTFGLVWFVGAASGESRRTLVLGGLAALAVAILLGGFGARPAPVLGIDGGSLQRSFGGELAVGDRDGCTHLSGRDWRCFRYDPSGSSWIAFRVQVSGMGCWSVGSLGRWAADVGGPTRGCIYLSDYVDLGETII